MSHRQVSERVLRQASEKQGSRGFVFTVFLTRRGLACETARGIEP